MNYRLTWPVVVILAMLGLGCGYTVGWQKSVAMQDVNRLSIVMPDNRTMYLNLEASLANHLADAVIQDGVYQLVTSAKADARLYTKIKHVKYNQIRASRTDGLRAEELSMSLTVSWEVYSSEERVLLESGQASSTTRFYIEDNLQIARQNAFPDVLQRISLKIISSLSSRA